MCICCLIRHAAGFTCLSLQRMHTTRQNSNHSLLVVKYTRLSFILALHCCCIEAELKSNSFAIVHFMSGAYIYFYHTASIEVFVQNQHFQGQGQWSLRPKVHKLPSKSRGTNAMGWDHGMGQSWRMQWDETMEWVSLDWNTEQDWVWKWKQKQPQSSSQEPNTLIIAQHCNSLRADNHQD